MKQTDKRLGGIVEQAEKERAGAAMWQHVCTAERKLRKPRLLSHTPSGSKLHGVLHSTHKQPPGTALQCMGEAGGHQAGRQGTTTAFSLQHNASKLQGHSGETIDGDTGAKVKVSNTVISHLKSSQN